MNRPLSMRTVIACWLLVVIAISVVVSLPRKTGKLYPTFANAGAQFHQGGEIYGPVPNHLDQYRYSPTLAAAMIPWSQLPTPIGGILWRICQAVLLFIALQQTVRTLWPTCSEPWLMLACLPLVAGNIFNGQLNPLMLAMMLLAATWYAKRYFALAAMAITIATLIKLYPLALGLLFILPEPRRFTPWLLFWLLIGFAVPWLLQDPDYVSSQYQAWYTRLTTDDRTILPLDEGYHDFQKLLRRWGMPMSLSGYRVCELLAGTSLAIWAVRQRRTRSQQISLMLLGSLTWCCLFGPSSESATYMLLAPVAVLPLVQQRRHWWMAVPYVLLSGVTVGMWFPKNIRQPYIEMIPQAHAALFLCLWLVGRYWPSHTRRFTYSHG